MNEDLFADLELGNLIAGLVGLETQALRDPRRPVRSSPDQRRRSPANGPNSRRVC